MRIERWNDGTLRRYHLESGAVLAVSRHKGVPRMCVVFPASTPNIACPITPEMMAHILRKERSPK